MSRIIPDRDTDKKKIVNLSQALQALQVTHTHTQGYPTTRSEGGNFGPERPQDFPQPY